MTQLILDLANNSIMLPESVKKYSAWEDIGGEAIEMISRRLVKEVRGKIWRVVYQYGFFDDATKDKLIESCNRGQESSIICSFLPPHGKTLITSEFTVVDYTHPTFMWSRTANGENIPLWADFAVELREVSPHD